MEIKSLKNCPWQHSWQRPANFDKSALGSSWITPSAENFEKASKGFIDSLLLNERGFPFIVLEAKSEDKNPLVGKEQARKYAKSQNCRFVILTFHKLP